MIRKKQPLTILNFHVMFKKVIRLTEVEWTTGSITIEKADRLGRLPGFVAVFFSV